jgi:hypothetical protein
MSSSSPPSDVSDEVLFRVSCVPVFTFILAPGPRSPINLSVRLLSLPFSDKAVLVAFPSSQMTLSSNSTLTTALTSAYPGFDHMEAPAFPTQRSAVQTTMLSSEDHFIPMATMLT